MKTALIEFGITYGPNDRMVRCYIPISLEHGGQFRVLMINNAFAFIGLLNEMVDLTNGTVIKDRYNLSETMSSAEICARYNRVSTVYLHDLLVDVEAAWRRA